MTGFCIPTFFGFHAEPTPRMRRVLPVLPFLVIILGYVAASEIRLAENPDDRFLPRFAKMAETMRVYIIRSVPAGAQGEVEKYESLLLADTFVSLRRLVTGVGAAAAFGLVLGLNMGLFPGLRALLTTFLTFFSIIPSILLVPILLIFFGVDEFAKAVIIFVGTAPMIGRDIDLAVQKMISREQITKSLTLGASTLQVVYEIVLPQVVPRWLNTTRLAFGSAWLFLIVAELVAASSGIGYRTFVMRRYLAMDGIIPYLLWATLLSFVADVAFRWFIGHRYPWYAAAKEQE